MGKKNNGFSLVELVVVILIMAIVVVALAPAVMQWVENTRISVDFQNYDSIVEAINVAITNEEALIETYETSLVFVGQQDIPWHLEGTTIVNPDSLSDPGIAPDNTWDSIASMLSESLGDEWQIVNRMKSNSVPSTGYIIRVEDGHVYRDVEPAHEDNNMFGSLSEDGSDET